ncbi:MAG: hypothetical protein MJE77_38415 [Proteobacteria bacterium]|nr:hypothetical protein [Pseudomonadota bacterium]
MKEAETTTEVSIEEIAAYEDDELADGDRARVAAEQLSSEYGRKLATVQRAVRERLAAQPIAALSARHREHLLDPLSALAPRRSFWQRLGATRPLAWSGWAVAAALAIWIAGVGHPLPGNGEIAVQPVRHLLPMAEAALADFRKQTAGALPMARLDLEHLAAGVGLPIVPLDAPDTRLLSAWQTEIRTHPAAALAYQWRSRIVIQYVIPEQLLYRQEEVRTAIVQTGHYTVIRDQQAMVARAGPRAGVLLVGEAHPDELAGLQ